MILPKRKQKIFDSFLYWNEKDMLLLRLHELDLHVTDFVIIEFDLNFKLNQYKEFLDLSSPDFDKFRNKITHLKLEFKNYDEYYNSQMKKIKKESLDFHEKFLVRVFDEIKIFLEKQNVDFEDIIMFSHVDEIPNLGDLEKIEKSLVYGPIVLKNNHFIHTIKYYQENSHLGTQIYNYSMIVRNGNLLFEIYEKKFVGEKNLPVTILKNGWHLSHFDKIERVVDNLNNCSLIYHKKFDKEEVLNCIRNLIPLINKTSKIKFKKTDIELPENLDFIDKNLGFEVGDFYHLIAVETDDIDGEYSSIRIINYSENPNLPFENEISENTFTYNLLQPRKELYESEDFFNEYRMNEIKLVIQWIEPLDTDKIIIRTKKQSKEFIWSEIKDLELYDIL